MEKVAVHNSDKYHAPDPYDCEQCGSTFDRRQQQYTSCDDCRENPIPPSRINRCPVKQPITKKECEQVIEILKTADSVHIMDIDSLRYPIRSIVGQSRGDLRMLQLKDYLERRKILRSVTGFMSLAERPPFLYIDSFTLEFEWFEKNCIQGRVEESKQISMF